MQLNAFYKSPVGILQLVQQYDHISKINFIDKLPALLSTEAGSALLEEALAWLDAYFNGTPAGLSICGMLDISSGTPFQQKVWLELLKIPAGLTISYRDLALRLGNEKVIRAAASANGKNPVPILIPCHRVIGADGTLTGYSGGLWRKKWLIEHERLMGNQPVQGRLFT